MKPAVADLGALAETAASDDTYSWRGHSLTPAEPGQVAALSAEQACRIAGGRSDGKDSTPSVVLTRMPAFDERRDREAISRLVYFVRHEGVSWMPSYPAGSDPRNHLPAIGSRTTLVDAMTGEILGQSLTGTSRGADRKDADPVPRERFEKAKLAPLWSGRAHLDGRFIAKADASLQQLSLELSLTISTTPDIAMLRPRVEELGTRFAEQVVAIATATESVLGTKEIDELVTQCRDIADAASKVAGSPHTSLAEELELCLRSILLD